MKRMNILYVIFGVIYISPNAYGDFIQYRYDRIFPKDYDKYEPPSNKGEPATVYVSILISDLDSIDEEKMEYAMRIHFYELWKDERLNLSCYLEDFKETTVFASYLVEHMWEPDLIFGNSKVGSLFDLTLPYTAIKILEDGSFHKERRYSVIIGCPMNLEYYPMDVQYCYFSVFSLSNSETRLKLGWISEHPIPKYIHNIDLPFGLDNLKYQLTAIETSKSTAFWREGNFTFLVAEFTFTRTLTGKIFNVYIPSTLVVLLSFISFWLDVEDVGARVTLGVTSLLTLTTQIVQVHSELPPLSYLTVLDIWLFACLTLVFCVFVEFAFAYQYSLLNGKMTNSMNNPNNDATEKTEIHILKQGSEIRILKFETRIDQETNVQSSDFSSTDRSVLKSSRKDTNLDKISRKAFPILFLIFSLFYWIYFLWKARF